MEKVRESLNRSSEKQLDLFQKETVRPLLRIVFSNCMNSLSQQLGEDIFSLTWHNSHPFENRLIVVPDLSIKEFLLYRFAEDPRLKIAAGIKVLPLNQAVMEIMDQAFSPFERKLFKKRIPSFLELSLAIEEKLYHFLLEKKGNESLIRYLDTQFEEKKKKRISSLSEELAKLFVRYGFYGTSFLSMWLTEKNQGWQQALWHELFSEDSPWTYPLEALHENSPKQFSGKIALFGFSYIAPIHLSFFCAFQATLYQLSPSALFWEDAVSDKERLVMGRILKKKGAKENFREEIDQYMQQGHAFLGNWGKLGREMLKSLDSFELIEEEIYQEPQEMTLLANLKKSLLMLDENLPLSLDDSIQIHSATSRLREIEVLRDALETLLQAHLQKGDPILPRDILIVCPDIAIYAPYIQIVFAQSAIPFAIKGIPVSSISPTLQGFLQLLKLQEERFAFPAVSQLLQCASFMEKNGFTCDEINQLCKWFKQAEIRETLFSGANSWEAGIDRLLYGLALISDEQANWESWPVASVPQSEVDLFNRFLELFEKIQDDLLLLSGEKSASEWLAIFLQIADKYFHLQWEKESFFQQLRTLSISCRSLRLKVWNFDSIERILFHLAQNPKGEISSPQLQKMTFTSLRLGNLRPARILWCLGMDEGAFPRSDSRRSLCEMNRLSAKDYYPSKTDEDRALFLDLFIKTQGYLIFSYQRLNSEDEKQQSHSILIEELNQYLIKKGLNEGITPFDHPAFPFDQIYFSTESKIKKWSESDFLAAKAHYFPQSVLENDTGSLFESLSSETASLQAQEIVIDIRQLKKLARHPLQFYFNETLKIYLEEETDEEEKEFRISFLRKSILRKKAIKETLPHMMRRLQAEGKLPSGLFQDSACIDLEEEVEDLLNHLNHFGVHPDDIHAVHLSSFCLEREKNEIFFPSLSVPLSNSKTAYIVGKLEDMTPKGLLFHGSNDLKSLVKVWPLYLIFLCFDPENSRILLTKTGEELELPVANPRAALSSYIEYFLIAKSSPSPLMPDWASALLKKSEDDLLKAMTKQSDDIYLNYLQRRPGLLDPKKAFDLWSVPLRKIFSPLKALYEF